MIKKIAIALVVLLGALLVYAATQPDTFRIQRAATIKAPPEKIFAVLNDFLTLKHERALAPTQFSAESLHTNEAGRMIVA